MTDITPAASPPPDLVPLLPKARTAIEQLLDRNLVPFWDPRTIVDAEDGGYRIHHDEQGRWKGPADKHLVAQARTLWFYARLAAAGRGRQEHLEAAAHGLAFLRDRLRDREHGGYYWAVDSRGEAATKPDKHVGGQAFVLFALAQYAIASGSAEAESLARELFAVIEERARDARHGGYSEAFARDWRPLPPEQKGYVGAAAGLKTANTHMHVMEAFTVYQRMARDALSRERLVELIAIMSTTTIRKRYGVMSEPHRPDWTPLRGPAHDRASYGHDLENGHLLLEACDAAGLPRVLFHDLLRHAVRYVLRFGYDRAKGGVYHLGPLGEPADRKEKVWWVQAEAMLAFLVAHLATGDQDALAAHLGTLGWIQRHQADWQRGEWHGIVFEDGRIAGAKAGPWKEPYHAGRALVACLELLPPAA